MQQAHGHKLNRARTMMCKSLHEQGPRVRGPFGGDSKIIRNTCRGVHRSYCTAVAFVTCLAGAVAVASSLVPRPVTFCLEMYSERT